LTKWLLKKGSLVLNELMNRGQGLQKNVKGDILYSPCQEKK
jgi:hypothetical protein